MESVRVEKAKLLETLRENRKTHKKDFELAWEGFEKEYRRNVENLLSKRLSPYKPVELFINLQVPEDHTEDYDRAIEMLSWEVEDQIELTETEFRQFVQDNWSWKDQFIMSNTRYTGSVSPSKL